MGIKGITFFMMTSLVMASEQDLRSEQLFHMDLSNVRLREIPVVIHSREQELQMLNQDLQDLLNIAQELNFHILQQGQDIQKVEESSQKAELVVEAAVPEIKEALRLAEKASATATYLKHLLASGASIVLGGATVGVASACTAPVGIALAAGTAVSLVTLGVAETSLHKDKIVALITNIELPTLKSLLRRETKENA